MEFTLTSKQGVWRQEVRAFFRKVVTPDLRRRVQYDNVDWSEDLYKALADGGYTALSIFKEYGGMERGYLEIAIFTEEAVAAGVPHGVISAFGATVHFAAHAILRLGTEPQREMFLPRILDGTMRSTQGFTEPGCGSDLAAVATTAEPDGDDFVVNGQKIFNSADIATHLFTLVRTDKHAPKHKGISILLVDLKSPGVTIHPMPTVAGWRKNAVMLDNVRVPRSHLLGAVNNGWYALMNVIDLERSAMHMPVTRRQALLRLVEYLSTTRDGTQPRIKSPYVRARLADIYRDLLVGWLLSYRVVWMQETKQNATGFASVQKVWNAEAHERLAHQAMEMVGMPSLLRGSGDAGAWAPMGGLLADLYLNCRVQQIGGGTMEIQRNIIAQRLLGLPRDV